MNLGNPIGILVSCLCFILVVVVLVWAIGHFI